MWEHISRGKSRTPPTLQKPSKHTETQAELTLWIILVYFQKTKKPTTQKSPTTTNNHKKWPLQNMFINKTLQLKEAIEIVFNQLNSSNNNGQNIQIYFTHNIKRIMENRDFSDDWHRQTKLLLIFPLTLPYDRLGEPSFQSRMPHVTLSLSYNQYLWEAQGKHEKDLELKYQQRNCKSTAAFHTKSDSYFF